MCIAEGNAASILHLCIRMKIISFVWPISLYKDQPERHLRKTSEFLARIRSTNEAYRS